MFVADLRLETPVDNFINSLNISGRSIVNSGVLKLSYLKPHKDTLMTICNFTLAELLFKCGRSTLDVYVSNILNMENDESFKFINEELGKNTLVDIIVGCITKLNFFTPVTRSKKGKKKLLTAYVNWCKYGVGKDSLSFIKLNELIQKYKNLSEKNSVDFDDYVDIASNLRFITVSALRLDRFLEKYSSNINVDFHNKNITRYYVYLPAGIYAVCDKNNALPVFWEETRKEFIETITKTEKFGLITDRGN